MSIVGYKLRINGGGYINQDIDVGPVFTYTFTGLLPETEYGVQVASYDEDDVQSLWSPVVYATTEAAPIEMMLTDDDGVAFITDDGEALTLIT